MRAFQLPLAAASLFLAAIVTAIDLYAAKWPALDPAEFANDTPQVDPEAGAEILLREVTIDDSAPDETVTKYYIRIRVYNERGLEELSKIELTYDRDSSVNWIEARTIKPDGTVLELERKDIFDREILKTDKTRVRAKSFAPPGLAPGVIVEYRYSVITSETRWFIPVFFRSDLPARTVSFKVRPFSYERLLTRCIYLGCDGEKLTDAGQGYSEITKTNQPASKEEPFGLPVIHTQPTILIYYATAFDSDKPDVYWKREGKELYKRTQHEAKASKAVTTTLAGIVSAGDEPEAKLRKIYDYCRTRIVNRDRDTSGFTREQKAKLPKNEHATDTLKHGNGTSDDINIVFAALARAAGLDARLVLANDRDFFIYSYNTATPFVFTDLVVAVREGSEWRFFDPGATYLPFGTLNWRNTDTALLIADPREAIIHTAVGVPSGQSIQERHGEFTLSPDGTLEGDVIVHYSGLWAASQKHEYDAATPAERAESLKSDIQATLKLAEVSDVKFDNPADPLEPLRIRFHLRVPEFGERTGSRIFIQPGVFQKGEEPLFREASRQGDILFKYRFGEKDRMVIHPPEGFTLEAGSAPASMPLENLGGYKVSLGISRKTGALIYERSLWLDQLVFNRKAYPTLKHIFDEINRQDHHALTFKRADAGAAAAAPAAGATASAVSGK